jgi:hypothetical protein
MSVNVNKVLSGGKVDGLTKRLTAARTSVATIAAPVDATDLRLLFTAGANGGFVDEIGYNIVGTGTQLAALVYIWRTDASGANAEVVDRFIVTVGTAMTNTNPGQRDVKTPSFENMASGEKIFISISVLSASCECAVWVRGGQFEAQ